MAKRNKVFTIGCDPEGFIFNAEGEPVCAAGLIPGSKQNPHEVIGGFIHPDGMAAEFGTLPTSRFNGFDAYLDAVISDLKRFLPHKYELRFVPSVRFSPEEFDKAPDEAKELGCIPDFDAYTGELNPPPKAPDDPYLRTAGGHIHIGFPGGPFEIDDWFMKICCDFAKQLDWFVGGWSVRMDKDPHRRRLYGKAGSFRPKDYGIEYRVPSNFWLINRNRRKELWDRIQMAIKSMQHSVMADEFPEDTAQLRDQINLTRIDKDFEKRFKFPLVSLSTFPENIYV